MLAGSTRCRLLTRIKDQQRWIESCRTEIVYLEHHFHASSAHYAHMSVFSLIGLRRPVSRLAFCIALLLIIFIIYTSDRNEISHELKVEAEFLKHQLDQAMSPGPAGIQKYMKESQPDENGEIQEPQLPPCTIINPLTNSFFDLSVLGSLGGEFHSWNAKGYDHGKNFSIGICSTPVKQKNLQEFDFPDIANKSEVGGYFTDDKGIRHSIGQVSTNPIFRGRKLILEYSDGGICKKLEGGGELRRSTLLSFTCDREIMSRAQINYVGSVEDCSYFFEVRTIHACATAQKEDDFALIYVFIMILFCALAVYLGGGMIYTLFKYTNEQDGGNALTHSRVVKPVSD